MWPFGSKKGSGKRIPSSRVMELSSRGVSEPEIIRTLKDEGYSPSEVNSAMKETLRGTVSGPPGPGYPPPSQPPPGRRELAPPSSPDPPRYDEPPPGMGLPPESEKGPQPPGSDMPPRNVAELGMPPLPGEAGFNKDDDTPPLGPPMEGHEPVPPFRKPVERGDAHDDKKGTEEIVERIIDEKWTQFSKQQDITLRFKEIQERIGALEQSVKNAESEKKSGFTDMEDKVDTFRQSLTEISSRIDAMEDAMKNTMNPLMESMNSLTEIVKNLKKPQG